MAVLVRVGVEVRVRVEVAVPVAAGGVGVLVGWVEQRVMEADPITVLPPQR